MTYTMILPDLHDPLLVLLAGLAIDAAFGDMPAVFAHVPHPVVLAGRAIAFFERKLNRPNRSEARRRERGIIALVVLVGGAAGLGWALHLVCRGSLAGAAVEALAIGILVAQRSLFQHVAAVGAALRSGGLPAGRQAVSHIVGRDPAQLDRHGVARAAIESLAENFSDGVVAPVFWYLVLGLPGLFAYKMANTLDSMIGHRSQRYLAFGWPSAGPRAGRPGRRTGRRPSARSFAWRPRTRSWPAPDRTGRKRASCSATCGLETSACSGCCTSTAT